MFEKYHLRVAIIKAAIVLLPSYTVAYLTDKMVYVVPTLAAAGFLAATLKLPEEDTTQRIDEDVDAGSDDGGSNFTNFTDG